MEVKRKLSLKLASDRCKFQEQYLFEPNIRENNLFIRAYSVVWIIF